LRAEKAFKRRLAAASLGQARGSPQTCGNTDSGAMQIREATREDADTLVDLFERPLYSQTNYMLMEPGESTQSADSLAGFEREGIKRHSRCVDGHYVDELYMSKRISP
jgi:hypothetical protein